MKSKELLQKITPSLALTRQVIANTYFAEPQTSTDERLFLSELERNKIDKIVTVLGHPQLQRFIEEDKITVAAIKPKTHESKLAVDGDSEGEKRLLAMVRLPLEMVFTVSLALVLGDIERFYPQELQDRLSQMEESDTDRWILFKDYMLSGPVSYILLYTPRQ